MINLVLQTYRSSGTLLQNCPQDWADYLRIKITDASGDLGQYFFFLIKMVTKELKQPSLAFILSICPPLLQKANRFLQCVLLPRYVHIFPLPNLQIGILNQRIYWLPLAAITNYHKCSGLSNRNVSSHSSIVEKSETGLISRFQQGCFPFWRLQETMRFLALSSFQGPFTFLDSWTPFLQSQQRDPCSPLMTLKLTLLSPLSIFKDRCDNTGTPRRFKIISPFEGQLINNSITSAPLTLLCHIT